MACVQNCLEVVVLAVVVVAAAVVVDSDMMQFWRVVGCCRCGCTQTQRGGWVETHIVYSPDTP